FFQAEDGIRDFHVTGVQTCALPILVRALADEALHADGSIRWWRWTRRPRTYPWSRRGADRPARRDAAAARRPRLTPAALRRRPRRRGGREAGPGGRERRRQELAAEAARGAARARGGARREGAGGA